MSTTDQGKAIEPSGLEWANGDYYVPQLASHGRSGLVPGPPDVHRQLFLERAAQVEPQLLTTLRTVSPDDPNELLSWAKRWNLTDRWCRLLARDTARWYATERDCRGWEFQGQGIFVASFPYKTEPLLLPGPFYLDLTYRKRRDFKALVLKKVAHAVDEYCDRTEAAARAAGLKRAPRKRELEAFRVARALPGER